MVDRKDESEMRPNQIAKEARDKALTWIKENYPELDVTKNKTEKSADIVIEDSDGIKYYFEVKGTGKKTDKYFGAATLTECECALKNEKRYLFLYVNITKEGFPVIPYTLEEIIQYMSIPPFKININILEKKVGTTTRKNSAKKRPVDKSLIKNLILYYNQNVK